LPAATKIQEGRPGAFIFRALFHALIIAGSGASGRPLLRSPQETEAQSLLSRVTISSVQFHISLYAFCTSR
jgi:hypothetical protein